MSTHHWYDNALRPPGMLKLALEARDEHWYLRGRCQRQQAEPGPERPAPRPGLSHEGRLRLIAMRV